MSIYSLVPASKIELPAGHGTGSPQCRNNTEKNHAANDAENRHRTFPPSFYFL
jgi:hypothetical protein